MFPSQISGVLFTEAPNHPSARRMVIEASHGLGEVVVSGAVTPDRFIVSRDGLQVTDSAVGNRPTLTPPQVAELGALALRVEQHFGQPQDIEWAWAEGHFALLQSRPIRGLELAREAELMRVGEITRLRGLAGSRRRLWVAHNLGETLPHPTPLTWDILRQFMSGDGGFGRLYRDFGYRPAPEVCAHGFLELIAGRIYADPDRAARLFWADWPMNYDLDALRRDPNAINLAPTSSIRNRWMGGFCCACPVWWGRCGAAPARSTAPGSRPEIISSGACCRPTSTTSALNGQGICRTSAPATARSNWAPAGGGCWMNLARNR